MSRNSALKTVHFGAKLAELRKAKGYTQEELAAAIGITQRMMSYWESTEAHPVAALLCDLARALDASTDELLGVVPAKDSVNRPSRPKSSPKRKS